MPQGWLVIGNLSLVIVFYLVIGYCKKINYRCLEEGDFVNKATVLSATAVLVFVQCFVVMAMGSSQEKAGIPQWLQGKIDELGKAPVANPPARVYKCAWQDMTVYYLPPQCCDRYSDLYDESGRIICHPDGGITGRGDGKCKGPLPERDKCTLIWKDDRSHGK